MSRASRQAELSEQATLQAEAEARKASGAPHPAPAADAPAAELEPAPAAAAPDPHVGVIDTSPIEGDDRPKPPAPPPPADEARDAIYSRARERRAAEMAETADDPEVANLDEQAGAPRAAAAPAVDAPPHVVGEEGGDTPPSGDDAAAGVGAKITIYGREVEVSDDQIREAGIAALQKTGAAEYRLQEAARKERELKQYHKDLDTYRDNLAKGIVSTKPTAPAAAAAPPATGARPAAPPVDKAKIDAHSSKIARAIFTGDNDAAQAAIAEALADVAQGRTATPPSADMDSVVDAAVAKVRELGKQERAAETANDRKERVNGTFQREFKGVWDNPEAFAVAHTRFQALMTDPANEGRALEELAREAGNVALTRYPELRPEQHQPQTPTPAPTAGGPADELANRRVVKRTVVRAQPAATGRKPAAPEAPAVPSNKDYVARLRANAGLPPL